MILAIDDIFYTKGPLLSYISATHVVSSSAATAMTAITVIGLTYRAGKKVFIFSGDSVAIMALYMAAVSIVYLMR